MSKLQDSTVTENSHDEIGQEQCVDARSDVSFAPQKTKGVDVLAHQAASEAVAAESLSSETVTPETVAPETVAAEPATPVANTAEFATITETNASVDVAEAANTAPAEPAAPVAPRSLMDKFFALLAFLPLIPLTLLVLAQTFTMLDSRALWFSDEVRYANAFQHVVDAGKWLILYLNGEPYPDKPPFYFWCIAGLQYVLGLAHSMAQGMAESSTQGFFLAYSEVQNAPPRLFFMASALSALLYTWVTYFFARALGLSRQNAFGAGLVLVSVFYMIGLAHYSRMDMLFATLITLSNLCFFRALQKDRAYVWASFAFLFAALATLTKGPLGIAFPFLSAFLFVCWCGRPLRFFKADMAFGFGLFLVVILSWISTVHLTEAQGYLHNIFYDQIYKRATNTWHHDQPWWHYGATLPAAWLPWTLLLPALPFAFVFSNSGRKAIAASRTREHAGMAYAVIAAVSGFVLLSAVSIKIIVYLMPLFAPLAILTACAVLSLSPVRSMIFSRIFALFLGVLAFALTVIYLAQNMGWDWLTAYIQPKIIPAFYPVIDGLPMVAGICVLFMLFFWTFARKLGGTGLLLCVALFGTVWIQPIGLLTAPSLDSIMSPKTQGEEFGKLIREGYVPVTYKVYSGTYTYYAGANVLERDSWDELNAAVAQHPAVAVAMQKKHWNAWQEHGAPQNMTEVHRQWIVDREFVLATHGDPKQKTVPDVADASEETNATSETGETDITGAPEVSDATAGADVIVETAPDAKTPAEDLPKAESAEPDNPETPTLDPTAPKADASEKDVQEGDVAKNENSAVWL